MAERARKEHREVQHLRKVHSKAAENRRKRDEPGTT